MVTVYFDLPDEEIISTSKYFNNSYTEEWLDDWAKKVIRTIDRSELISEGLVESPVLGPITIREISATGKTTNAKENANELDHNLHRKTF